MDRQPVEQELMVNRGIIRPHIRLEDKAILRQCLAHLPHCACEPAMAVEMCAPLRQRQIWWEDQGQRLHDHRIPCPPQVYLLAIFQGVRGRKP